MTAGQLQALSQELEQETLHYQGAAEQARLRGLTTETYGLPETSPVLIRKLRAMDPALRQTITQNGTTT